MRLDAIKPAWIASSLSAAAALATLAGCTGSPKPNASGMATGGLKVNTDNGLELRRWTLLDQPAQVGSVLAQHSSGAAVDPAAQARLRRNGWRLVRVPIDQLDAIEHELGGATVNANEWHGQATDWRSLQDQPIDFRGQAVAVDGQVERFDRGEFRLMIRSWSVQTEDGPFVHLEIVPKLREPQVNRYKKMLGQEGPTDAGFGSLGIDLLMEAGYAYVLVGESPQAVWPGIDPEDAVAIAAAAARRPPRTGPSESVGPDAAPPKTLGELLLPVEGAPPTRSLLVFVPKIAPSLFPPGLKPAEDLSSVPADGTTGAGG